MLKLWFRARVEECVKGVSYQGLIELSLPDCSPKKFSVVAVRPLSDVEAEFIVSIYHSNTPVLLAELVITQYAEAEVGEDTHYFTDVDGRGLFWSQGKKDLIMFCLDVCSTAAAEMSKSGERFVTWNQVLEWRKNSPRTEHEISRFLCSA